MKERLFEESGKDSIPVGKFDSDQVNHSPGRMKALSVATKKLAGGGTHFEFISKLFFFFGMATVFVVAIFIVVAGIKLG